MLLQIESNSDFVYSSQHFHICDINAMAGFFDKFLLVAVLGTWEQHYNLAFPIRNMLNQKEDAKENGKNFSCLKTSKGVKCQLPLDTILVEQ